MMQFTDLPAEIIIMIVRKLDFQSLLSIYNTCRSLRGTVSAYRVITECNISMSVMATVNSLNLNLFRDISNHLLILNMRGVPDLFKTKVMPVFKKLKCLKTLDISYTNLNILDLMEIHSVCPTLKDVTVNFVFGKSPIIQITQNTILQCQSVFQHFKNVHFVGSLNNLLNSKLAVYILEKAKLQNFKLSAVEVDNAHTPTTESYVDCEMPHLDHFAVYLINWKTTNTYECLNKFPVLSMVELKNYEFFIIHMTNANGVSVCGTSIFEHFFNENFDVTVECVTDFNKNLKGNVALMLWNKETTQFNNIFFYKLHKHIGQYFPYFLGSNLTVPTKYDWCYIEPIAPDVFSEGDDSDAFDYNKRRKRMTMATIQLNYEEVLKKRQKIQLTFVFNTPRIASITLRKTYEYLRIVTFLNCCGVVYYSSDFFTILFQFCYRLETLSVESSSISPCTPPITRSIMLSNTLKNINIIDRSMNLTRIFTSFAQCRTLENIHLKDIRQWEHFGYADPSSLLENCPNLCSVVIEAPFSERAKVQQLQMFSKVKTRLEKPHVKVVVNEMSDSTFKYNYDPFLDVFKLNPIKPI